MGADCTLRSTDAPGRTGAARSAGTYRVATRGSSERRTRSTEATFAPVFSTEPIEAERVVSRPAAMVRTTVVPPVVRTFSSGAPAGRVLPSRARTAVT